MTPWGWLALEAAVSWGVTLAVVRLTTPSDDSIPAAQRTQPYLLLAGVLLLLFALWVPIAPALRSWLIDSSLDRRSPALSPLTGRTAMVWIALQVWLNLVAGRQTGGRRHQRLSVLMALPSLLLGLVAALVWDGLIP